MDNYQMHNGLFVPQNDFLLPPVGSLLLELRDAKSGKLKSVDHFKNMFVTTGKQSVADALRGNVSNGRGQISYMELGTSSVAPALTDTGLLGPLFRKLISVRSASGNVATFQTFFSASEVSGTLREAGLYGDDANGTLLSGKLFCRAAINRVKSASDTLTITWTVTIG